MKGQLNVSTPEAYIAALDEPRRSEIAKIDAFICEVLPELERYIHIGLISYGRYTYRYASGKTAEWAKVALASNAQMISLYASGTSGGQYFAEMHRAELPKAKIGKSCIRFKKFEDLDPEVLKRILRLSADWEPEASM